MPLARHKASRPAFKAVAKKPDLSCFMETPDADSRVVGLGSTFFRRIDSLKIAVRASHPQMNALRSTQTVSLADRRSWCTTAIPPDFFKNPRGAAPLYQVQMITRFVGYYFASSETKPLCEERFIMVRHRCRRKALTDGLPGTASHIIQRAEVFDDML